MNLTQFSNKQLKVLTWWMKSSPVKHYEGIICDGSIRSGKTVSEGISFFIWSFANFSDQNFALCGKTINSFRRNVWNWAKSILRLRGYQVTESRDENKIIISYRGKRALLTKQQVDVLWLDQSSGSTVTRTIQVTGSRRTGLTELRTRSCYTYTSLWTTTCL